MQTRGPNQTEAHVPEPSLIRLVKRRPPVTQPHTKPEHRSPPSGRGQEFYQWGPPPIIFFLFLTYRPSYMLLGFSSACSGM
ncbi:hypothetical protein CDAR_563851 [Caerostris darwini]|uniref:Uncharacterized protein n=1 Tax=Caerostris darwini TaxID=1538125 RepID=A0AAV4UZC7_9ARAC|nr:hypothetical protein CDAR_563851 [Caerostris darwini]